MPAIAEIAAAIEEIAPKSLAEDWDNVGVLVDCGGEIDSILVSLDVTDEVVSEAEANGCQLIVAHHPVIFKPLHRVVRGDMVYRLIRKGISVMCAHTNLDIANGGVNDILAALFELTEPQPFANGVGRVGQLKAPTTTGQLARRSARVLGGPVRLVDTGKPVRRLAVISGSGGGLLDAALATGADCLLTGEADHHDALDAKQAGMSLVVAGHFATEYPVVPVLANWLGKQFGGLRVFASRRNKDPFVLVEPE